MAMMHATLPYAMIVQAAISPIVDPPGLWEFRWTSPAMILIGLSGIAAFLVNFSGFLVMGNIGALAHVLLGQFKTAVIMLGGYILFQSRMSPMQLLGALLAVLAIVAYTHVTVQEKSKSSSNVTKEEPPPPPPSVETTTTNTSSPDEEEMVRLTKTKTAEGEETV
eukprot:CAMPEP_0116844174 /NCGR_PEP_ID=MMETSP0418-20121206/12518_1 /TAXON_ID=1158023 /ORGANISM="Astrosyne radiata, Strain 13vi08-1A" /LENGTH=164 /DNA_ID=CAMNT_0004475051 /DNA_START=182 /DNA_END=676 /DNA_ORIENTATION=+